MKGSQVKQLAEMGEGGGQTTSGWRLDYWGWPCWQYLFGVLVWCPESRTLLGCWRPESITKIKMWCNYWIFTDILNFLIFQQQTVCRRFFSSYKILCNAFIPCWQADPEPGPGPERFRRGQVSRQIWTHSSWSSGCTSVSLPAVLLLLLTAAWRQRAV